MYRYEEFEDKYKVYYNEELIDVTDNYINCILQHKAEIKEKQLEILQEENTLLKERILQLEVAEVNRKSMEIEKQILGGI